jgi:hypothetical protein
MSTLGLTLTFGWAMLRYATSTFARAGRAAGGGGRPGKLYISH